MKRVTSRFVRYYAPGLFVANEWTAPVESLDPMAVNWPDNAYAFTLHERVDVIAGQETFTGKTHQIGPTYYHPDSKVFTVAEIAARCDSRDSILLSNMRCNKWPSVIYSRWGDWPQPYDADEVQVLGRLHTPTPWPKTPAGATHWAVVDGRPRFYRLSNFPVDVVTWIPEIEEWLVDRKDSWKVAELQPIASYQPHPEGGEA